MEQSRHGQGITSVKVHHPSGGSSSFSLAHDDGADDRWGNSGKVGAVGGNQRQAPRQQQQQMLPSEEAKQNAPEAGPGSFTSVKYSGNPPGGKSSITF